MIFPEVWRPVKGYEGIYEVSSFGGFRSIDRCVGVSTRGNPIMVKGHTIKRHPSKDSYVKMMIKDRNGKVRHALLHQLVAETFIENPENKPVVNHRNGLKRENFWWNLQWTTYSENNQHARAMGFNKTIGETHHWAKINQEQALQIFTSPLSYSDLSKMFNVSRSMISNIKRGHNWTHVTGKKFYRQSVRLNPESVIEIYKSDLPTGILAERFSVTRSAINYIKNGESYSNITAGINK